MKESRSIKVDPRDENTQIELWAAFGWELKSSQEINKSDTDIDVVGDTIYTTKTTENYVKLLFERDTEMKNYAEIASLEREYDSLRTVYPLQKVKAVGIVEVFCFFIGPIGWVIDIVRISKHGKENKKIKEYNKTIPSRNAEIQKQRALVMDKVRALR